MQKNRHSFLIITLLLTITCLKQLLVPLPVIAQDTKMFDENSKLIDILTHKDNSSLQEKTKNAGMVEDRLKALDKDTKYLADESASPIYADILGRALQAKALDDSDFCRLYKKVRGPGARFDKAKSSDAANIAFAAVDNKADIVCKEKKPSPCPKGLRTISDCVKEGVTIDLIGDGSTTTHCLLELTNPATGATTSAQIHTMCISRHTQHPPQPRAEAGTSERYKLGGPAPVELVNIVKAAHKLAEEGKFASVPLPQERKIGTIMQLGIWRHLGGSKGKDKDAVTNQSVTKDLLARAHITEKQLSSDEKKALTSRVDQILEAVDLTEKTATCLEEGKKPTNTEEPETPPTQDHGTCPGNSQKQASGPNDRQISNPANGPGTPAKPGSSPQQTQPLPPAYNGKVCIPQYSVFESQNRECQDMMTVEDAIIDCPAAKEGETGSTGGLTNPPQDEPIAESCCKYAGCKSFPRLSSDPDKDDDDQARKDRKEAISKEKTRLAHLGKDFYDEDEPELSQDNTTQSDVYIFFVCNDKAGSVVKAFKLSPEEAQSWEFSKDEKVYKQRANDRKKVINKYRDQPDASSKI